MHKKLVHAATTADVRNLKSVILLARKIFLSEENVEAREVSQLEWKSRWTIAKCRQKTEHVETS